MTHVGDRKLGGMTPPVIVTLTLGVDTETLIVMTLTTVTLSSSPVTDTRQLVTACTPFQPSISSKEDHTVGSWGGTP